MSLEENVNENVNLRPAQKIKRKIILARIVKKVQKWSEDRRTEDRDVCQEYLKL